MWSFIHAVLIMSDFLQPTAHWNKVLQVIMITWIKKIIIIKSYLSNILLHSLPAVQTCNVQHPGFLSAKVKSWGYLGPCSIWSSLTLRISTLARLLMSLNCKYLILSPQCYQATIPISLQLQAIVLSITQLASLVSQLDDSGSENPFHYERLLKEDLWKLLNNIGSFFSV